MNARIAAAVLVALTALAFGLRLSGLDKLLPYIEEADPGLVVQVQVMRDGLTPDPVDHKPYLAYPTLLARFVAPLPKASVAPSAPLREQLAAASSDFVRMRTLIALLSSLLVPLTWLLARRFIEPPGALTAAAFVALSLLHLLFSQQARPHGAHATVALAAVLAHLALLRKPSVARLAISALACAAAVAVLHTGVFTFVPLAVAWWLAKRDGRRLPWWNALLALVPGALAVWLFYPRAPQLEDQGSTIEFGGHTLHFDKLDFTGFRTSADVLWNYDPGLTLIALLGAAFALTQVGQLRHIERERRQAMLVVAAYALPYLLAIGIFGETVDRFLLPLIPFLALFAGLVVAAVRPPLLQFAAAALALASPAVAAARYVGVRDAPDTYELAAAWVREHVDPQREHVLVTQRMTLPLFHDAASLAFDGRDGTMRKKPWIRQQLATPPANASEPSFALFIAPTKLTNQQPPRSTEMVTQLFDEVAPSYVLIETSKLTNNFPGVAALREGAAKRGYLIDVIRGEDEDACLRQPLDYQEIPDFVTRLMHARAFGPCIEIYRMAAR